jgi:DNA-binding XRE family transcriptional regulator
MEIPLRDPSSESPTTEHSRNAIIVTGDALQQLTPDVLEEVSVAIEWLLRARLGTTAVTAVVATEVQPIEADITPDSVRRSFANHVHDMRQNAQRTQTELAAVAQTSQSAVSDLEAGRSEPRLSTFTRIAAVTGNHVGVYVAPQPVPQDSDINALHS